jgi:hypothetical protein
VFNLVNLVIVGSLVLRRRQTLRPAPAGLTGTSGDQAIKGW